MGSLFSGRGGIGGLASPLNKTIDPVGNATSDALFGKMKKDQQRAASVGATNPSGTTDTTDSGGFDGQPVKFAGDGTAANRNEKLKPITTSSLLGA